MRAYLVDRRGFVSECEIADSPPLHLTSNGRRYIYRDRMEEVAMYEEDESPTT